MIGIVGGNSVDRQAQQIGGGVIGEHDRQGLLRGGEAVVNGLWGNNHSIGTADLLDLGGAEMIAVGMAHENQVRFGQALVGCLVGRVIIGIVVNYFAVPIQHERGVIERVDDNIAFGGRKVVAGKSAGFRQLDGAVIARAARRRDGIGVLQRSRGGGWQSGQRAPSR